MRAMCINVSTRVSNNNSQTENCGNVDFEFTTNYIPAHVPVTMTPLRTSVQRSKHQLRSFMVNHFKFKMATMKKETI